MSKLELGVCYYPEQWEPELWRDDAARMVEMGLDWVRIAEFTWGIVEPIPGRFEWAWLDDVVGILGQAGLKVMMCTPTAAPPKWLVDAHPEILPVGPDGRVRGFGSRRHYCFSSEIYLVEARRIAREYASRYGQSPHVHAWQIDNEYNDHDTVLSYSGAARDGFRKWLQARYGDIETLNRIWGTAFWGAIYSDFDQIELPTGLVAAPNPTQALDFARYSSDRVQIFNRAQVEILREFSPGRDVTHNFMAGSFEFDHHAVARDLDVVGFDSYPLGNLLGSSQSEAAKRRYLRTGEPDYQGFHCDLYRSQGRGRMWVLEQQPGPVDWADKNPAPADGMVRLWTWAAYAHGAQAVMFFRWRQSDKAQEQDHTGLFRSDGSPDQAAIELAEIARERQALLPATRQRAEVAMLLDYPSIWAGQILPNDKDYRNDWIIREWYAGLRSLGIDIDFIGPESDLDGYRLIVLPQAMIVTRELEQRLEAADAKLLIGARAGSRTADMHSPSNLAPGALAGMSGVQVTRVESLPDYAPQSIRFSDGTAFEVIGWREDIETTEAVLATFEEKHHRVSPAITRSEKATYLAMSPTGEALSKILRDALGWAGLDHLDCPHDMRLTRRGNLRFAFNFADRPVPIPCSGPKRFLVGNELVAPHGVSIWHDAN